MIYDHFQVDYNPNIVAENNFSSAVCWEIVGMHYPCDTEVARERYRNPIRDILTAVNDRLEVEMQDRYRRTPWPLRYQTGEMSELVEKFTEDYVRERFARAFNRFLVREPAGAHIVAEHFILPSTKRRLHLVLQDFIRFKGLNADEYISQEGDSGVRLNLARLTRAELAEVRMMYGQRFQESWIIWPAGFLRFNVNHSNGYCFSVVTEGFDFMSPPCLFLLGLTVAMKPVCPMIYLNDRRINVNRIADEYHQKWEDSKQRQEGEIRFDLAYEHQDVVDNIVATYRHMKAKTRRFRRYLKAADATTFANIRSESPAGAVTIEWDLTA